MNKMDEYDVVVAGGGIAGISAGLSAARNGAKVLLIEKECVLGGLATLGLITIFLPLCDGMGNQVIYGIGEELLRLSIKHGYEENYPKAWLENGTLEEKKKHRYLVQYNPNLFAIEAEQLLIKEKVDILYDTWITGTELSEDGKTIKSIQIVNKSGSSSIYAKTFVDCTGDADLCHFSKVPTSSFKENKQAAWYYGLAEGVLDLRTLGAVDKPAGDAKEEVLGKAFSGMDAIENSRIIINSHRIMLEDILERRKIHKDMVPVNIPTILQVRMTRKIIGEYELASEDEGKSFDDSIGLTGDWRKRGPVYHIPYRCLYSSRVTNLAVAGRCISVSNNDVWDITRVIPCCCVTGEAAGAAAALAVRSESSFAEVDIRTLQNTLERADVKLRT